MAEEVVSRARALSTTIVEGVHSIAKAILPSHGPPQATFASIESPSLPRLSHSIAVVKGRAYIFGGETAPGALADNSMHVVILPSSAVLQADYLSIPAKQRDGNELADIPAARRNHAAAVVGDDVFIFGGEYSSGSPADSQDHPGRVWVFETRSNTWTALDPPANSPVPNGRVNHALAASEIPQPAQQPPLFEPLPQTPMDPAKFVPEIPDTLSSGTLFLAGGKSLVDKQLLNDVWAFDIKSRTWTELASLPGAARVGASLAVSGQKIYRFGGFDGSAYLGGGIDSLDFSALVKSKESVAQAKWEYTAYDNGQGPRDRSGAGLIPVTGAQGHSYLLVVGGEVEAAGKIAYFDDVWAFRLPTEGHGDVATRIMGKDSKQASWNEVGYQYLDANGDVQKDVLSADGIPKKGLGGRGKFGVTSGTEVDGASVVVWGGVRNDGKVCTDGWLITIER